MVTSPATVFTAESIKYGSALPRSVELIALPPRVTRGRAWCDKDGRAKVGRRAVKARNILIGADAQLDSNGNG